MKKSILSLGLLASAAFVLVSCGSTKTSTVAYGSLSSTKTYASTSAGSVSEKQLYDLMRSSGYSTVKDTIKKQLFSDVLPVYSKSTGNLTNTTYFNYDVASTDSKVLKDTYEINASVVGKLYGVSDVEAYKALNAQNKETALKRAVDTLFKGGVRKDDGDAFTYADLSSFAITFGRDEHDNDVFTTSFPYALYEELVYNRALQNYALAMLKDSSFKYYYENKFVPGHGTNSFYVEDKDLTDYYYQTGKYYRDYRGVVIKFSSQTAAERIISSALSGNEISANAADALKDYIKIYNQRYSTRDDIDETTVLTDKYTNLSVSYDKNNLAIYDQQVQEMFRDNMEANDYLTKPMYIAGSYYLIFKISGEEIKDWSELSDAEQTAMKSEILDYCLRNKSLASLVTLIENERFDSIIDNKAINFYDPIYAVKFSADYSDFDVTATSNNDYVYKFTYNDNEYTLKPEELYEKLEPIYGTEKAVESLEDKWLLSLTDVIGLIDADQFDDAADDLNSELKKFRKGKADYSKVIGTNSYLQLTHGYSTKEEVLEAKKADVIEARLTTFYGDFANADGTLKTGTNLFTNFVTEYKNLYDAYFNASISHILIGVDADDSDGFTDPDYYIESLPTAALKTRFKETIVTMMNAVIKEVKILTTSKNVKDALDYIATAFEYNYKIGSLSYEQGTDIYWNDLKNEFPIHMKAEDLSTIDLYKAGNYMEEFSDRAKVLYDKVIADEIKESDVDDKGVFEYSDVFADFAEVEAKVCKTVYGYHLLNIYDIDKASSAVFKSTSDTKLTDGDEYMQYEHLKVVIIPDDADGNEDDDDDPEFVIYANGYSDNDYASESQLFIYFYEQVVVGSSTLLKSSVRSAISTNFDQLMAFFRNSSFQKWMILKYQVKNITFQKANQFDLYMTSLENGLYSYTTSKYTLFQNFIDGTYDWTLDYSWSHK